MTIQQAFDLAFQHHQAGRLREAEQLYRQILAQHPAHIDALYLLGVLAHQVGRHDAAVDLIQRVIAIRPNWPEACFHLGDALNHLGRADQAIAAYRQTIALKPDCAEAHYNLGNVLNATGRGDEAISAYRQAIALKPSYFEAYNNLGSVLQASGRLDEAIAAYQQTLSLRPNSLEAYNNLGNSLRSKGLLDQAMAAFRQAIALKPNCAEAYNNLGNALKDQGQIDPAIAAYRQAIAIKPTVAEYHTNLGVALRAIGQSDQAIAAYRQALAIKPALAEAYNNLGVVLKDQGQLDQAIAAFHQAITLQPNYSEAHSNLLFTLHYPAGEDAQAIVDEHRRWNQQHAAPLRPLIRPHLNDRNPDRRLRIGYVSPDLHDHVVGWYLLPLLANHDHRNFEIFAYAQVPAPDAMTQRLREHTDGWRSLLGLSNAQAADLIRQDHIDILVDLAGHTTQNRLLVFAHKPAPVQVTYLGYPNTTGLATMDYRLSDAYADPPGQTEAYHCEHLLRLSPCAWCFAPTASPPLAARPPGPITFGCFNNFPKVTEPMLKRWGHILLAVPASRLLLKSAGLGSASVRLRVQQLLGELGIGPERLELRGREPGYAGHLALYGRMDIALDTFPYHGTTTTCEALWMGVPVVSLAGLSHVARVGVSLLHNVGLPELVANTPAEYVRLAVDLANDLPRLQRLHSTLRPRLQASPLMDAPRFARNVEAAYRQMWWKYCAP